MTAKLLMPYNLAVAGATGSSRYLTWRSSLPVPVMRRKIGSGKMGAMTGTLILLRHGESEWNAKNLFTGWVDVDLAATGEAEARHGGELIAAAGALPDVVHTSVLRRAIRTSEIALHAADRHWIPVRRSWRLNERHYGALQGKDKKQTLAEYGEEQFMLWRRSYDVPPPPLAADDEFSQFDDPRYAGAAAGGAPAHRVPQGRAARGSCRTGTTRSSRTCAPARPCWSSRTATRCGRSSSTSTRSRTRRSRR